MANLAEHYILTLDPACARVFAYIEHHKLTMEVHLNRTRFWIDPNSPLYTDFILRFGDSCPLVNPTLDPATGHKLQP
jgi:hypothetical protein